MSIDFELLPHTADLKIRVYGATVEELFKNALIGMFQSIGPRSSACTVINDRLMCKKLPIKRSIEIQSSDLASLLVDFLSEALTLSDIYNEAYLDVVIKKMIPPTMLEAELYGIKIDRFEVVEIKAVTYHDLEIKKTQNGWQTDIVFDI